MFSAQLWQRNTVRFATDPCHGFSLLRREHVSRVAVDRKGPPRRPVDNAAGADTRADDPERAHSRRIIPPRFEGGVRCEVLVSTAHLADMAQDHMFGDVDASSVRDLWALCGI